MNNLHIPPDRPAAPDPHCPDCASTVRLSASGRVHMRHAPDCPSYDPIGRAVLWDGPADPDTAI